MSLTCVRCQKAGEAPPAHRVPFPPAVKEKVLASICASCWREWEDQEIKVINEYRLNFMEPEHRAMLVVDADPDRLLDRFAAYTPPVVTKWIGGDQT